MNIKKELINREIAGERFLVPVGKTVYDSHGLFILTEVGGFIWDLLPEAQGDLRAALLHGHGADSALVHHGLLLFGEVD